jgi:hypothetical protein
MRDDEAKIVRQCIADLLAAGFALSVWDGGATTVRLSVDAAVIFAALGTTDDDELTAYSLVNDERQGWVQFVYGNEPGVVISDYTTNLETILAPTMALAESLED